MSVATILWGVRQLQKILRLFSTERAPLKWALNFTSGVSSDFYLRRSISPPHAFHASFFPDACLLQDTLVGDSATPRHGAEAALTELV